MSRKNEKDKKCADHLPKILSVYFKFKIPPFVYNEFKNSNNKYYNYVTITL